MTTLSMNPCHALPNDPVSPPFMIEGTEISSHGKITSGTVTSSWWPRTTRTVVTKPQQEPSSASQDIRQVMLQEALLGNVNLLRRRPERISLLLSNRLRDEHHDLLESLQLLQDQDGRIVIDQVVPNSILDMTSPTSKPFEDEWSSPQDANNGKLIQDGDVLESINGWPCEGKPVPEVRAFLAVAQQGDVCLTISTRGGRDHSGLCQLVVLDHTRRAVTGAPPLEDALEESSSSSSSLWDLGLRFAQRQGVLQVQDLSPCSVLTRLSKQGSGGNECAVLQSGDLILSMGVALCASLSAKDAELIWQSQMAVCQDCLSILTLRPTDAQRRWNRLRRAAVAVGGGTLVGVGAVIMVTPLHPIGHAMTIGGVGVLGTEFEGPKRAMQVARDSFRRKAPPSA